MRTTRSAASRPERTPKAGPFFRAALPFAAQALQRRTEATCVGAFVESMDDVLAPTLRSARGVRLLKATQTADFRALLLQHAAAVLPPAPRELVREEATALAAAVFDGWASLLRSAMSHRRGPLSLGSDLLPPPTKSTAETRRALRRRARAHHLTAVELAHYLEAALGNAPRVTLPGRLIVHRARDGRRTVQRAPADRG